jgi:tetratricopeptide (TPR) repeat protein
MQTTPQGLLDLLSLESELELWRFEHSIEFVAESSYAFFVLVADTNRLGMELIDYSLQRLDGKVTAITLRELDQLREAWNDGITWVILNVHDATEGDIASIGRSLQGNRDWMAAHRKKLILLVSSQVFPKLKRSTADFFALVQYTGSFVDLKSQYELLETPFLESAERWRKQYELAEARFEASLLNNPDRYLLNKARIALIDAARRAEQWKVVLNESEKQLTFAKSSDESHIAVEAVKALCEANLHLGNYPDTMELLQEFIEESIGTESTEDIEFALSTEIEILTNLGEWKKALQLAKELVENGIDVGYEPAIAVGFHKQAILYEKLDEFDKSLQLSDKSIEFARRCRRWDILIDNYLQRTSVYQRRNEWNSQIEALQTCHSLLLMNYSPLRHGAYLLSLGTLFDYWGRVSDAIVAFTSAKELFSNLGNKIYLLDCKNREGSIFFDLGQLDLAMTLFENGIEGALKMSLNDRLARSLGNKAMILHARGRLDEAMNLHKEEERMYHELGSRSGLAISLFNQSNILSDWGRSEEAMVLLKEVESKFKEIKNEVELVKVLNNQAAILQENGLFDEALALYRQSEKILLQQKNKEGLARVWGNQAIILKKWGRQEEAMSLLRDQEKLVRELGNMVGLASCLGNQALILKSWNQLDKAMILHREAEELYQQQGNKAGLASSLGNQASILEVWGRIGESLALILKARDLAKGIDAKLEDFLARRYHELSAKSYLGDIDI